MKKLLFFLLLTPIIFAQKVVGDTTDLKLYDGSGIVILEQYGGSTWDLTGGGLFHMIDSTYDEGTHAFDHIVSGKQWARLGAFGTMSATTLTATTLTTTGAIQVGTTFSLDSLVSIGTNVFATTAAADTVVVTGTTTDDVFLVSPIYVAGVDQQDVLEVTVKTDTLIINRIAAGESALKYGWVRFKTH